MGRARVHVCSPLVFAACKPRLQTSKLATQATERQLLPSARPTPTPNQRLHAGDPRRRRAPVQAGRRAGTALAKPIPTLPVVARFHPFMLSCGLSRRRSRVRVPVSPVSPWEGRNRPSQRALVVETHDVRRIGPESNPPSLPAVGGGSALALMRVDALVGDNAHRARAWIRNRRAHRDGGARAEDRFDRSTGSVRRPPGSVCAGPSATRGHGGRRGGLRLC